MAYPTPRLVCGLIGAALLFSACTTKKQEAPSLTGPSELSTSLAIAASPDVLAQDGASQSLITVTAYDSNGQLLRNLSLRAEIAVDGSITDFGSLSARNVVTDATGRAFVTYTAPPPAAIFVDSGTMVQIRLLPAGTNFANETTRFASIRLVPPGGIGLPPSPFRPEFAVPNAVAGDPTTFSATVTDPSGNDVSTQVSNFAWNFGDGRTASGRDVTHTFNTAGNYSVSLTITDFLGRSATAFHAVAVAGGQDPTATITTSPSGPIVGQNVNFNGSTSRAAPGHTISSYSWDFGDGTTGGGPTVTHAYSTQGSYTVLLTVTDNTGRIGTATSTIPVAPDTPQARFTFAPAAPSAPVNQSASVAFDANTSTAANGRTLVLYSWNFGDGTTGTGPTIAHSFQSGTTHIVVLTVTDNLGKTNTVSQSITVAITP